jgi:hypothetical protein
VVVEVKKVAKCHVNQNATKKKEHLVLVLHSIQTGLVCLYPMAGVSKKKRRSNINEVQPQFTYLCIGNSIDWHQPQTDPTFLFQTMFSFLLQAQQTFFFFVLFQQLALPLVMLQRNNQTFIVVVVAMQQ